MSFWSDLGENILDNAAAKSPLARALVNRYRSSPDSSQGQFVGPPAIRPDGSPQNAPEDPTQQPPYNDPSATPGTGVPPAFGNLAAPGAGQQSSLANVLPQEAQMYGSQWNQGQPQQQGSGAVINALLGKINAAQGTLVTSPTIARIGEKGPEAVVPLTPRPGNKMQPDILEGHVSAPRVPGVRYSRYRTFNRLGPGQGGEL